MRVYERVGLLVWLSLGVLLASSVAHHLSRLPGPYTWFEPLFTLRTVLSKPRFPLAVLAVYGSGRWARRGAWQPEAAARRLASAVNLKALLPFALRRVSFVVVLLVVDGFVLSAERDLIDLLALTALALLCAGHQPSPQRVARELGYALLTSLVFLVICYGFTVSKALLFAPGRRFDAQIIGLESALFGCVPHRVLAAWATVHPAFAELCDWVYFHFFEHMALVTVLLVALGRRRQRTEYLGALALCHVLGGLAYHSCPALGPSFAEPSYFAFLDRPSLIAGGIRRWLLYNTQGVAQGTAHELRTWGYIACMPSLHIAHELVMLYYSRGSRLAFGFSLAFALLTQLAVVVLGWHYLLDSLGGAAIAALAIAIARWQSRSLMPRVLWSDDEPASPPARPVIVPFLKAYLAARAGSKRSD